MSDKSIFTSSDSCGVKNSIIITMTAKKLKITVLLNFPFTSNLL